MPDGSSRCLFGLAFGLVALGALAAEMEIGLGVRPDLLGLESVYSVMALPGGDLVAFGRDSALRGLLLLVPSGKRDPGVLAELAAAEAAQIRQPNLAAIGAFALNAGKPTKGVVLLYQRDDTTPYWLQKETGLVVVVVDGGAALQRTVVQTVAFTSVALKDKNAEPSRWENPGGQSDDPALAEDPPGLISRVSVAPFDVDRDGWQDLVLFIDGCRSVQKNSAPSGKAESGCPAGFAAQPTRAESMHFDAAGSRFEEPKPLPNPPGRSGHEVTVGGSQS